MNEPYAILIDTPEVLPLTFVLYPPLKELDYVTQLHNQFVVFNYPQVGSTTLVSAAEFRTVKKTMKQFAYVNLYY